MLRNNLLQILSMLIQTGFFQFPKEEKRFVSLKMKLRWKHTVSVFVRFYVRTKMFMFFCNY